MTNHSYADYLNSIKENISGYFDIISFSIGIPCNIISIFIFARLMRNKNNMGFLYVWQCSVDLCVLLCSLFIIRSHKTFGISLSDQSDLACKLFSFLRRFITHTSSWIAVITTFDRFTFVLYGHRDRFRFLKSKRNLIYMIFITFLMIAIMDTPNLFFHIMKNGQCNGDILFYVTSDIISILVRTYIPISIMVVFNIIMIRKIIEKSKSMSHQSPLSQKESHFTMSVIAFDVYSFILNFPLSLFFIFYDINLYLNSFQGNKLFHAYYNIIFNITHDISFCKQTFSFLLYFACNKLFRNELLNIIGRFFRFQNSTSIPNSPLPQPTVAFIHSQHQF